MEKKKQKQKQMEKSEYEKSFFDFLLIFICLNLLANDNTKTVKNNGVNYTL